MTSRVARAGMVLAAVLVVALGQGSAQAVKPQRLLPPKLSTVSATGSTTLQVTWTQVSGNAGYIVRVYEVTGQAHTSTSVGVNETSTVVTGLARGTSYRVSVQAKGDSTSTLNSPETGKWDVTTNDASPCEGQANTVPPVGYAQFAGNNWLYVTTGTPAYGGVTVTGSPGTWGSCVLDEAASTVDLFFCETASPSSCSTTGMLGTGGALGSGTWFLFTLGDCYTFYGSGYTLYMKVSPKFTDGGSGAAVTVPAMRAYSASQTFSNCNQWP